MSDQGRSRTKGPSTKEWAEATSKSPDDFEAQAAPRAGEDDRVRKRAYELWEKEGQPHGKDQAHWYKAEQEIKGGHGRGVEEAIAEKSATPPAAEKAASKPRTRKAASATGAAETPEGPKTTRRRRQT
jgi:hypothetical protein